MGSFGGHELLPLDLRETLGCAFESSLVGMARRIALFCAVTTQIASSLRAPTPQLRRRRVVAMTPDSSVDMQELMAKQHDAKLEAVDRAKKEVYKEYEERISDLEAKVAAAAAAATAAAPGAANAWTGARDYGWLAQIHDPLDVPKALCAAALLAVIMAPGIFGTYQIGRWFAVQRGLVGDDDEDAKGKEGQYVLGANIAIAVAVNSQCLDLGY